MRSTYAKDIWMTAAIDNDTHLLKKLKKEKIPGMLKKINGETPLMCAVHKNNIESTYILLAWGAKINELNDLILFSIERGYWSMVELLLAYKPDLTVTSPYGLVVQDYVNMGGIPARTLKKLNKIINNKKLGKCTVLLGDK